ncbi:hypothetical protein [Pseudoalteromonas luteoviolacea]|uniref:Uncharacterized protein n=1 Tax=Pseudoalteromonas luteoviolacea H33 TaxID=1365251 RepID=A0A167DX97_9GAMM|nr:hypothetical protein [Pseudoalteromonas luteoviolacea]KZN49712.1 hypothetical protein N476_18140 [Pseudoalteromonas luteoviolacea H33]KZN77736.1 hypothetical protein N477_00595 [Pseudoalteromonas luteoviolacea H33-S]MBQ4878776.1 hypothetical protein [Pseudoalteromonas luteoviolacea]MBQ4907816.1 hypothetical protein [Pseudoalteromonas luteoviolacea]
MNIGKLALAGSLVLGIGLGGAYWLSDESQPTVKNTETQPKQVEISQVSELKQLSNKIADEIEQLHPLPKQGEVSTKERMLVSFNRMQASVGKFNSSGFVKAEIQALLNDPAVIELAKNTLVDLEGAMAEFGDDQALARVYSIKILDELAKQGETSPLYETTAQLAEKLNEQANQDVAFSKRQDLDLEELVFASLNSFEESQILENPQIVMDELGYSDAQHEKIRKIYGNLFGSVFVRHASIDESIARVQELFNKQGTNNG